LIAVTQRLEAILNWAVVFLGTVFFVLVLFQLVARYVFGVSIFFAAAVSNYVFIWFAMVGAALAMKDGLHVAVEIMPRLPGGWQIAGKVIAHLFSLAFVCVVLYASISAVAAAQRNVNPALGFSVAWGVVAMPVGAALIAWFIVDAIWGTVRRRIPTLENK
jgi:TRAP-type C4-dicarboxylate transport system permease small subunit